MKLLDGQALNVVGSPIRQRLLGALSRPESAAGLARQFGMSRQRVGYHMRELQKAGLLELVGQRTQRGCTERFYRARSIAYVLEADSGDPDARAAQQDRFSWAALLRLAGRVLRELVELRRRADRQGKRLPTLAIETEVRFAGPAERRAFTEEITAAIERIAARYQSDAGSARGYRLFLGAYPHIRHKSEEPQK